MSVPTRYTSVVLFMLFHKRFDVVKYAVLVVSSPGYAIKLLPAVIRTLFGSAFCGQKSTTILAYGTVRSLGVLFYVFVIEEK